VKRIGLLAGVVLLCIGTAFTPLAAVAQRKSDDLSTASLEELTQIHISVSSFARKDEDLWTTPAAVFVITKEDIARSSASSIPELLRMVPGLQVAQIDASNWAISARGFNSAFADKLLVLIDGRTVYSEEFSGAQWDQIDLPLEDIERIEVIRGPGAAVWGTNAVNGVINIITKKGRSTTGLSASDNLSRIGQVANIRYGADLGQRAQYRAFASYIDRSPFDTASGMRAFDGEKILRGGGRIDWQQSPSNLITVSGDLYGGHVNQQIEGNIALNVGPDQREKESLAGGHVLSLWDHKSKKGDMALQFYYDDRSSHQLDSYFRTRTVDVDYQDHLPLGPRNDLVWGAEVRFTGDRIRAIVPVTTLPDYKNQLADGFAQDEIAILPRKLTVTLGSKIQYGTLAGFQIQPSARALWAPSETQSLWIAVSRAAVAPSLQDKDIEVPLNVGVEDGLPVIATLMGNPKFKPETVVAYELGYRRRIGSTLTLDIATFFNNNRRIQSLSSGSPSFEPTPSPHIEEPLWYTNGFRARTGGVEATASWKPFLSLSFQGSYTWMQAHTTQTEPGLISIIDSWSSPRNNFSGSASWNFAPQWSANSFVSYVGALPSVQSATSSTSEVPAYTRLDLNLARKVGRSLEFEVGGTNFLTPRHFEFADGTSFAVPAQVPRSAFVKATWTF
jgi:iron complex outermembrane receptor protein